MLPPSRSDPPGRRSLPRRTALAALAAASLAATGACTADDDHRSEPSASPRASAETAGTGAADPDVALAARVLAAEEQMLARVTVTVRQHPRLAPVLAGARAAHAAHVRLLAKAAPSRGKPTPGASASPSVSPSVHVPAGRVPALLAVAGAEAALRHRHTLDAVAARSGAFARVLASLAAASAQQAAHLSAHAAAGPGS